MRRRESAGVSPSHNLREIQAGVGGPRVLRAKHGRRSARGVRRPTGRNDLYIVDPWGCSPVATALRWEAGEEGAAAAQ